jgi:hypothetical protein
MIQLTFFSTTADWHYDNWSNFIYIPDEYRNNTDTNFYGSSNTNGSNQWLLIMLPCNEYPYIQIKANSGTVEHSGTITWYTYEN